MAAIAFPWNLCTVFIEGYVLGVNNNVRRTPFEDGFIRQARSTTVAMETRSIRYHVKASDVVAFRAWSETHSHRFFNWRDLEDNVTREMRVQGGHAAMGTLERIPNVEIDGEAVYQGSCILEGFPDAV